jgi:DNA-binding MarR family transcriptional regulator
VEPRIRLAERGHGVLRPSHGAVFQYLDDTGMTVSVLAERAQMTKQAMAELVQHLETHGYVVRVPDPSDRRAKLVQPTERGRRCSRSLKNSSMRSKPGSGESSVRIAHGNSGTTSKPAAATPHRSSADS